MTKQEFLDGLKAALLNEGSQKLVEENIDYYSQYIDTEVSNGKTVEEVLNELGDPRLIANSILQAAGYKDVFDSQSKIYTAYDTPDGDKTTFAQGPEYHKGFKEKNFSKTESGPKIKGLLILLGVLAIIILLFVFVLKIISGIAAFLGPVGIILLIVVIVLYKRRR